MKKILSLLVLLVTTLSAFALDFTDYRKVTLGSNTPTESNDAKLSITDNNDGTYNVTFNDIINKDAGYTDKYGTFTFSNVPGSQTGDFTTVTGTNLTGKVTGGDYGIKEFTGGELSVKFKEGKAYATMVAKCALFWGTYTFNVVFGTDEGFDGGSTGGGDEKPAIVDVVEADYAPNGAAFGFPFTINWETQKLVAKLDLSTCSRYTHNEGIITVGTSNANGDISLWNPNTGEANCHLYYTHYYYGSDAKLLNLHYLENPSGTVKRVDNSLQNLEPGLVVFTFDKDGLHVGDNIIATPDKMTTLYNSTSLIFGSKEGDTRSSATYKYVKVVPLDWTEPTEPTEPEVTVKTEVPFTDVTFSVSSGVNGTANVTFKEMSDETVQMTFDGGGYNIALEGLAKGTDTKGRTTYTGEVSNGTNTYTVNAVVYSEGTTQKLYMTMVDQYDTKFTVGEDPDYVAPEPPASESTIVENWQSTEGTSWSHDVTIDWDTQKLVASINLASTTGEAQGFLGVTKQGNSPGWNNYGIIFYNQTTSTFRGYAPGKPDNANTHDITKGEDPVRFEISKAEGVKCQGNVVISAENIAHLTNQSNIVVGAADNTACALYNYIKVVPLNWTETTTPETPEAVVYKNTLKVVRGTDTKTYEDAEVSVLAKGEGKYAVTIPSFSDMDANEGTIGKLTFEADGVEENGTLKLTATSATTTQEGGNGWDAAAFTASMDATVTGETLAGTFTVVYPNDATNYTYTLYYGVAAPDVITEVSNKTYTSNLRIFDGEETAVDEAEAQVNVTKYSDDSYKVTLKNVSLLNQTSDLVFEGTALVEETTAEADEPLTIMAKSDEATTAVFGVQLNGTFEITEVSAEEIKMGFSMEGGDFSYTGEFNYEEVVDPEVYTSNLHIYDATAPETDLFQTDKATVEFLATASGEFTLTLKDVTLNDQKSDLVFTGMLPTTEPGGQDPLAEEGGETPTEPAMVLNATADEATATFLGATSATAVFNVIMNDEAETENDAFALTFTITAGDKNYAGEFNYEKKDPVEEYPVNFDKTAKSTHSSRALNSFSLQQTGKDKQTESVYASKAAYEDHTSKVFTVEAGSELTASFDYTGEWMHSFVYIDFDNDGDFSYKEGQWDQTGTDLVAFSFYSLDSNPKNDASGYNSVGDELTGDARNTYVAPSFKAPAKAGEYRIRFKIDWNCILPGGSSSILSDGGGVWDATLKVVEPVVDGISSINAEAANGEAQLFTIDGVKLNKLQKGLNIVRTADGKVKKVLVK